jgi:acetaldehyde dehydrogenase (acetylating)
MMPSMTLGSGGVGGSISGDNITTTHLMDVKRLAYEIEAPPPAAIIPGNPKPGPTAREIEKIVQNIAEEILNKQ